MKKVYMKERHKRKKLNIKHTLVYLATYVVVTFGVALFMVVNSSTSLSSGNKLNFTMAQPSAIEKVLSSITENENIELSATVDIAQGDEQFGVLTLGANVQFGDQLEDIKVDANANFARLDYSLDIGAKYIDGMLYLNALGAKYSLATDSLINCATTVGSLFGLDLDGLMAGFDTSALATMDNTVIPTTTGYIVVLNIDGININLFTDEEYNLKNAQIDGVQIGDYTISLKANVVARNNGKNVEVLDSDYTDISGTLDVLGAIANAIQTRYFAYNINLHGANIDGYISFADGIQAFGVISASGVDINYVFDGSVLYLDALGAKVKIDLADYSTYKDVLTNLGFNLDIDIDKILSTLNNISIDVISDVQVLDGRVLLTIANDYNVEFGLTDNVLDYISTSISGVDVRIDTYSGAVAVPTVDASQYVNMTELTPYLPNIIDIVRAGGVQLTLDASYMDYDVHVDGFVSFNNGLQAYAYGNIFGLSFSVHYFDNLVYLKLDNACFVLDVNDVMQLLDNINLQLPELTLSLSTSDNGLVVSVADIDVLVANNVDGLLLSTNVQGANVNAHISAYSGSIPNVVEQYYPLDIVTLANQVLDIIDAQSITLDATADIAGMNMHATISAYWHDEFVVNAYVDVLGRSVQAIMQGGVIYVTIDNSIKLSADVSQLPALIDGIKEQFADSLGALSITLNYDGSLFSIGVSGANVMLDVSNGTIDNISVQYGDIVAEAVVAEDTPECVVVDNASEYDNDASDALPLISAISNLINAQYVYGDLRLEHGKDLYKYNVFVEHNNDLDVQVTGSLLGKPLDIRYVDGNAYLSALGLNYYVPSEYILSLMLKGLGIINTLDIDITNIQITKFVLRDSMVYVDVNNDIHIYASIANNQFSSIQLAYGEYSIYVYLAYGIQHAVAAPAGYTELSTQFDVLGIIDTALDIYNTHSIALNGGITYGDIDILVDGIVTINSLDINDITANINITALDYSININVFDGNVYVCVADIVYMYDSIDNIINFVTDIMDMLDVHTTLDDIISIIPNISILNNQFVFSKDDISVTLNINSATDIAYRLINTRKYTNKISDLLPYIKSAIKVIDGQYIGGNVTLQLDKEYQFDVFVDYSDGIDAQVVGTLLDKPLDIRYVGGDAYISALGLNYYIPSEYIDGLIDKAKDVLEALDINVDIDNFSITKFAFDSSALYVDINGDIHVCVAVSNNQFDRVYVEYGDYIATVNLTYGEYAITAPTGYTELSTQFDVLGIIDTALDVYDTHNIALNGGITYGDIDILVDGVVTINSLDINDITANINITALDYSININVFDGNVYVCVADVVYMYDSIDNIMDLATDIMDTFGINLTLDDIVSIVPNISYLNGKLVYSSNDIVASFNVNSADTAASALDNLDKYDSQISNLLPYIKAAKKLLDADMFGANVSLTLDNKTYTATVGVVNNDGYSVALNTTIMDRPVSVVYASDMLYLNIFGYKACVPTDEHSIDTILNKVYEVLDVNDLDGLQSKLGIEVNTDNIISNITFDANTLTATLFDSVNISISVNNNSITNIDVAYDSISASVALDYSATPSIDISGNYDNIIDKLDIIDGIAKVIDTYNNIVHTYTIDGVEYTGYDVAFHADVRFGNTVLEGEISCSVVPTMVNGEVENKIYASVYGTWDTLTAKIYLVDNVAYVDILGLKVKIALTADEIDNILAWINDKFDKELSLDGMGEININMPDLSTLVYGGDANAFSLKLGEFTVNTSRFADIALLVTNGVNAVDELLIGTNVYDGNITDIGTDTFDNQPYENADTIHKNLVMRVSGLTYNQFANYITLGDSLTLGGVAASQFVDYTDVLDFVDGIIDYIYGNEYAFTLNATCTEYNPTTNQSKLYARANNAFIEVHNAGNGTTDSGLNIDYLYASGSVTLPNTAKKRTTDYIDHTFTGVLDSRAGDNMLYATYTNSLSTSGKQLKAKISTDVLLKLVSIVCRVMGVNTAQDSTIAKFANLPNVDNLDVTNLRYLLDIETIDTTDFEHIDGMLSDIQGIIDRVKSIEFVTRTINGVDTSSLVACVEINGEIMELRIVISGGSLSYISATNVQVTRARNLDITLDVTKFKGTNNYNKSASHFNLSTMDDLITSFVNNSAYNDYHITGTATVSITLAGIIPISLDVPMDIKVKIVNKKPQVMAQLTIPIINLLVYNVNDDLKSHASERTVNIYYADGYLYTYRTEKSGKYEKMVKQDISTLGSSIMDYIQYISGLNDDIMSKINEAMAKTINRTTPIDYTNVISNYSYTSSSSAHNITINLKELANNDQLNTGSVTLYTGNNGNKKYINKADLDIDMPVATGVDISIKTTSGNPIKLVNIGSPVDISTMTNFISSYQYGTDVYMEKTGGSWYKAADKQYTITFDTLGGGNAPSDIVNKAETNITLPVLTTNKVATVDNVEYTYKFMGWTLDSLGEGEVVSWTKQPRGDKTLYAVWQLINTRYLLSFVTNSGYSVSSIRAAAGQSITLPTISGVKNIDGADKREEYVFDGWFIDSACTVRANYTTMPQGNTTLYAGWKLNRTVYIYTVKFVTNGATTYADIKVEAGTNIPNFSSYKPHKHDTTEWKKEKRSGDWVKYYYHYHTRYTFAGWYTNSGLTSAFGGTVNGNITLYAKYTSTVTVHKSNATLASINKECNDSCYGC